MIRTASLEGRARLAAMRAWQGPWANLPERVRDHPTMLTREELRMLRWLGREYYAGEGCICDLGAFLGGSTMALADGLMDAGWAGARIHSYDRHRIDETTWSRYVGDRLPFPEGGNFLPAVPVLMGDRAEVVTFHTGDFPAAPLPAEPIEILFVDIAKTAMTSDHVACAFFPRLIPGRSVVVQQDYFHPWPVWDVAAMEILSDHFEPLSYTEQNSALFLCTRAITPADAARVRIAALTPEQVKNRIVSAGRHWPHTAQKLALYHVLRLLDAEGGRPLAERRETSAKEAMRAHPLDRAEFERLFLDPA